MSTFTDKIADAVAKQPVQAIPDAAVPAEGVSLVAMLRYIYNVVFGTTEATGKGTIFWVKKTVTSSAILAASAVDITGVSSGGDLEIEQIVVKSDSTGLATGTNFELKSNNAKGLLNIFVETVANLGASKTIDLDGASVTKIHTVLESGKKLQVQSTVAACTGTGTIDIHIKFRRLAATATIAAA